jgi:hypothetical protein
MVLFLVNNLIDGNGGQGMRGLVCLGIKGGGNAWRLTHLPTSGWDFARPPSLPRAGKRVKLHLCCLWRKLGSAIGHGDIGGIVRVTVFFNFCDEVNDEQAKEGNNTE